MKAIFITTNDIFQNFGGAIGTRRNYDMLCQIYGSSNVDYVLLNEYPSNTVWQKLLKNIVKFIFKQQHNYGVLRKLDFSKYDLLFNDSSITGNIITIAFKNGFSGNVISYFHNCEYSFYSQLYSKKPFIIKKILLRLVNDNELLTLRKSTCSIVLNKRDLEDINRYYNISFPHIIIPVSIKDRFNKAKINSDKSPIPVFTFVGSYFAPNVDGVCWFVDKVLPYVNIRLQIVGRGMSALKDKISSSRVTILSDIDELDRIIYDSDCMLFPIFEGSGMKLKTCESLMLGKSIIGTPESFQGYEIDDFKEVGACCSTAEEFIEACNDFKLPKFNSYSRHIYLTRYSYEASKLQFEKLLNIK